jgi:hypothetical protein
MPNTTVVTLPKEFAIGYESPGVGSPGVAGKSMAANDRLTSRKDRRAQDREPYKAMVPMAAWDVNRPGRITELRFTTVRCLDLSPGGLAIVLPRLPTFTEACFCLARDNQPVYFVGRVANVVEGFYERRHQFRVGVQFIGQVRPDGSMTPIEIA